MITISIIDRFEWTADFNKMKLYLTELHQQNTLVVADLEDEDNCLDLIFKIDIDVPQSVCRKLVSKYNEWIKTKDLRDIAWQTDRQLNYDLRMQDWACKNFNPSNGTKGE